MKRRRVNLFLFLVILCFLVSGVFGEENLVRYVYSGKEMSFDRKTGVTILKGDAKVTKDKDHMNADQITVYKDMETDEIIKIDAVGNVDMKEGDMTAKCEHAIMYEAEDRIEMEGSPAVVDDGRSNIEAPNIVYFRKENRLEAKGGVSGYIMVKEEKTEEAEKTGEEGKSE